MKTRSESRDLRALGAIVALALDIGVLTLAVLLVLASVSPAFGWVLAGTLGLIVAPVLGWRYGPAAVGRGPAAWAADALRSMIIIGAGVVVALVILQGPLVPAAGGIAGRLLLVVYAAVMDTIVVGALTLLMALPLGVAWTRLMRRLSRSV